MGEWGSGLIGAIIGAVISGVLSFLVLSNDYYNAKFQLFLRLNEKEPLHIALKKEIEELEGIVSSKCVDKINDVENRILEIARTVLKIEWDRVRQEAKGEK